MNTPGRGVYKASKTAIEAIHDVLKQEVSSFGIKILIVKPGSFRTPWTSNMKTPMAHEDTNGFSEGYKGTLVEQWVGTVPAIKTGSLPPFIKGGPAKAAREIVKAVIDGYDHTHMMLKPDCVKSAEQRLEELRHDLEVPEQSLCLRTVR